MIDALTKKQRDLEAIAERFRGFRSFVKEFRRVSKGKPVDIHNRLAWDAVVSSLRRMIIIDLAAWVDSLHSEWFRKHLQGTSLAKLKTSKRLAEKLVAKDAPVVERRALKGPGESLPNRSYERPAISHPVSTVAELPSHLGPPTRSRHGKRKDRSGSTPCLQTPSACGGC
jgi:hypothetical protein